MTQFVSSLVIYFVSDFVAPSITADTEVSGVKIAQEDEEEHGWLAEKIENRDPARTGRALTTGGAAAVLGYR